MIFFFSGSQSYSFAAKNTNGAASIVAEPQYVKKICWNFFIKKSRKKTCTINIICIYLQWLQ